MTYEVGSALFVLGTTAVLSTGQAWALRASGGRRARHGLVWLAATLTMSFIASAMLELPRAPEPGRQAAALAIFIMAGIVAAVALWIGSRLAGPASRQASDLRSAVLVLIGIHAGIVIAGGGLGLGILIVGLLAEAKW